MNTDGSGLKGLTLLRIAIKISGADQLMKEREKIVEEMMRP
jgi:hypothetical protein